MDVQRLGALLMVAFAFAYLGRNLIVSARAFFADKGGCGGGCAKCAFAEGGREKTERRAGSGGIEAAQPPGVIALSDIRVLPRRQGR